MYLSLQHMPGLIHKVIVYHKCNISNEKDKLEDKLDTKIKYKPVDLFNSINVRVYIVIRKRH